MTSPIIRAARTGEARALSELALRSKASWGYSAEMMVRFRAELTLGADDLEGVFALEHHGGLAGFYSLEPVSSARVELGHLFVEPALRGQGFGTLMMADAVRRARAGRFRLLEIQGDPNAVAFYEQAGAKRIGERESDSIPGRMLPLFEVALVSALTEAGDG